MCLPSFAYPFVTLWVLGCFQGFGWYDWCYNKHLCANFCVDLLWFFLVPYPGEEVLGHMVTLYLMFWGTTKLFSKVASPPTSNVYRIIISPHPCQHLLLSVLLLQSQWVGDGVSLWLWSAFLWWWIILSICSCTWLLFVYLPWRNIYWCTSPVWKLSYLSFNYWVLRVLYRFWIEASYQICDLQILLHVLWVVFSFSWWCHLQCKSFRFGSSPNYLIFLPLLWLLVSQETFAEANSTKIYSYAFF